MSHVLDELFLHQTGEDTFEVYPYSELLERVADSCPDANIVLESQQWSRIAAVHRGKCTIHEPKDFDGDTLPFNPQEVAVQITYYWDRKENRFDLAWVATEPFEE